MPRLLQMIFKVDIINIVRDEVFENSVNDRNIIPTKKGLRDQPFLIVEADE